ncbi:hypothetical protein VHEMI05201 [[Torrubiella] hemipterigena]|uniref:INO80 complex subunit F domain-containing protein n=1 Tax=[Torrubiella] hemipterigena TaxID=1531966 RepID=A0A0A1TI44_9HYPO|nr:hypothetical protein VHEMI05201 [[Torrubiella] hemipterigena]
MMPYTAPPSLPPSVEEAYRRKCVQLKHRTLEVEESNDAARLRLARIKRQVEKLRIERAFLLEQLAKRTSTNVEDSEGSPSPPPTPQIQDKPLRTKRGGYRKASGGADADTKADGDAEGSNAPTTDKSVAVNGDSKDKPAPKTAQELYGDEQRPVLEAKNKDGDVDIEEELTKGWEGLSEEDKKRFQIMADEQAAKAEEAKKEDEAKAVADAEKKESAKTEAEKPSTQDEDVEMANYDTEDQDTQMDKDGDE